MVSNKSETLLNRLLEENAEYKKLLDEHTTYNRQLNAIDRKKILTAEDETEIVRLKKLKLSAKDRMEKIVEETKKKKPLASVGH